MQNIIWKIIEAGKWSVKHFKIFIIGLIIFLFLFITGSVWHHNHQCNQGKYDKLSLRLLLYEHECNLCADTISLNNNNSVTNNGTITFFNNGNGKISASGITIVEPNKSVPAIVITNEFIENFNKVFGENKSVDAYYSVPETSPNFPSAKLLMDGLKLRFGTPERIIWSLPSHWKVQKPKNYIVVDSNSIQIIGPSLRNYSN